MATFWTATGLALTAAIGALTAFTTYHHKDSKETVRKVAGWLCVVLSAATTILILTAVISLLIPSGGRSIPAAPATMPEPRFAQEKRRPGTDLRAVQWIVARLGTGAQSDADLPRLIKGLTHPDAQRSEERRVGKECRSRWSP